MKLTKISAAVALTVASSSVMALAPTETADVVLQISGATAADKQVENYINQLCEAGTLDRFNNPADSASAFFCNVLAADSGLAGDRKILFHKASGGSSQGVEPVTGAGSVPALDLGSCTETAAGSQEWTCSNTTVSRPAEVGISDVEPELFSITANGAKNVDLSQPLTVSPVNAQTFGIVVSPGLRDALQTAQGLIAGSDEVSEMPSLSSNVIANLFAGNIASWNNLKGAAGAGLAAGLAAGKQDVNICLRSPGSGTQAQFNAFYMKNSCAYRGAGNLSFVGLNTATDSDGIENNSAVPVDPLFGFPLPGPHIHKNKGSSDLGKCITNVNADDRWAIGVQSLEKTDEGRTNRNDYKFVAVDGVAPVLENVASGLYRNWAAASIQWRNDIVTGEKLTLAERLVATAQEKTAVSTFNASLRDDDPTDSKDDRPAGGFRTPEILDGGVPANVGSLAFAKVGVVPSFPFDPANPVSPFNQGFSNPSSCSVPAVAGDIDVTAK